MTGWVILVDQPKDLPNAETPHKVITTSEYLARPRLFDMARPKLVNLGRGVPTHHAERVQAAYRQTVAKGGDLLLVSTPTPTQQAATFEPGIA